MKLSSKIVYPFLIAGLVCCFSTTAQQDSTRKGSWSSRIKDLVSDILQPDVQEGNIDLDSLRAARTNEPVVHARFVPDSVFIGDVFEMEVTVEKDIVQMVFFPDFENDMIGGIVEIISAEEDTVSLDGRRVTLRKNYKVQIFEEGEGNFGTYPVLFLDKNIIDTIQSRETLNLKVGTFEIDTLTMTIRDIKDVMPSPLKAGEFSGYVIYGLIALALICAVIWYIITKRRNLNLLGRPKVVEPPHVIAIKALENLHNQKLWQNNKHKLYYTGLTDILREYIGGRYGIHAMEMTSDEIIVSLKTRGLPDKNFGELKDILNTADLVKFAKYTPEGEYNEAAYTNAYYFVEGTKPTEIEPTVTEEQRKI